jgi:hypothetical protein
MSLVIFKKNLPLLSRVSLIDVTYKERLCHVHLCD